MHSEWPMSVSLFITGIYIERKSTGSTMLVKVEKTQDYESVKKMVHEQYEGWTPIDYALVYERK